MNEIVQRGQESYMTKRKKKMTPLARPVKRVKRVVDRGRPGRGR